MSGGGGAWRAVGVHTQAEAEWVTLKNLNVNKKFQADELIKDTLFEMSVEAPFYYIIWCENIF